MIKFKVFSRRDTITVVEAKIGFFGPRNSTKEVVRPAYQNTHELYEAVAKFADAVGDNLITITGTPKAESFDSYTDGEVVVWYRQKD